MKIEEVQDIFNFFEKEDVLNYIGTAEIVDFLIARNRTDRILDYFDEDEILSYFEDLEFIADDEEDAIQILRDNGYLNEDSELGLIENPFMKESMTKPCINLIQRIVDKEGFNYLYSILEPQKDKLHIL
jgi:hypothetical protein